MKKKIEYYFIIDVKFWMITPMLGLTKDNDNLIITIGWLCFITGIIIKKVFNY